jgi:hypothetical protein
MGRGHLHSKTKKELQALAQQAGIPGWPSMSKKKLLSHLWGRVNHDIFAPTQKPISPVVQSTEEQKVKQSKYSPPEKPEESTPPEFQELPMNYGDNRIVLMVRDPHWIFAYWEITAARLLEVQISAGTGDQALEMALRVYQIAGPADDGRKARRMFDIEITDGNNDWQINVPASNRSYCVEIGLLDDRERFSPLARSNVVTTPRAGISDVQDESRMSVGDECARMYDLSEGREQGNSSQDLQEKPEKLLPRSQFPEAGAEGTT